MKPEYSLLEKEVIRVNVARIINNIHVFFPVAVSAVKWKSRRAIIILRIIDDLDDYIYFFSIFTLQNHRIVVYLEFN